MRTKFGKSSCTSTSPDTSTCLLLHALITHGFKGNHDARVRVFKIRGKKQTACRVDLFILFCFLFVVALTVTQQDKLFQTGIYCVNCISLFTCFRASLIIPILFYLKQKWGSVAVELLRAKVVSPTFFFLVSNSPSLRSSSVRVYICFVGKEGQQFKPLEGVCSPGRILKHPDATFTPSFNWLSPRYL